jgi:hypothetical protein
MGSQGARKIVGKDVSNICLVQEVVILDHGGHLDDIRKLVQLFCR